DPLVGTDAFWLTRPIARRALLESKLEFVALVVVFPQVVREMAVMAANGVTARHMLLAFPEVVLHDLLVPSLVMVLAALTPSFARFVLAGVSVMTAAILAMLSFMMLAGEGEGVLRSEPLPDLTSWLILLLAASGAAACVVA